MPDNTKFFRVTVTGHNGQMREGVFETFNVRAALDDAYIQWGGYQHWKRVEVTVIELNYVITLTEGERQELLREVASPSIVAKLRDAKPQRPVMGSSV